MSDAAEVAVVVAGQVLVVSRGPYSSASSLVSCEVCGARTGAILIVIGAHVTYTCPDSHTTIPDPPLGADHVRRAIEVQAVDGAIDRPDGGRFLLCRGRFLIAGPRHPADVDPTTIRPWPEEEWE